MIGLNSVVGGSRIIVCVILFDWLMVVVGGLTCICGVTLVCRQMSFRNTRCSRVQHHQCHQLYKMKEPTAKFRHEPDLVDILWRQDVDLGVEREIFDGCLRQRVEEAVRASEQKRELERIMQRLQKLDKETGEILPSPSSVNSQVMPTLPSTVSTQHSPITQNPLLTALLFSKSQKAGEQMFSELPSVPDLQYYLDLLETESMNSSLEDIIEVCSHNPSHKENSADTLCDLSELTQTISDSLEVVQPLLSTPCNPCISSTIPPENLNQMRITKHQMDSSEFCPELTNTYTISTSTPSQTEGSGGLPGWEASHVLSCVPDSPVLTFDDSASSGSVDMDTSLYTSDTVSGQSEEELECIQSNYIDLLPISIDSKAVKSVYETVTCAQDKLQTQREVTSRGVRRVCRDEQRARALGLPLSVHDIITLPVEAFNEAVNSSKLNNAQLTLIRDIRRRGKNKMAAQSCRKRKLDGLIDLEDEVEALKRQKIQGEEEQERNIRDLTDSKKKLRKLYSDVFNQLRNEHGHPYDPKKYKLQLSTDGTVYLLPHSMTNKRNTSRED